jgi:pimeloyl-ACP methyl ester carboxylesterase
MLKTLEYKGGLVEYEIKGKGLPVMLLHGFTEDRRIWDPLLAGIEEKYTWILPDLPGSGRSAYNGSLASLSDYADLLMDIVSREKVGGFVLIGHSMGGYISLAFAKAYPGRLLGLGLFHSSAYADSAEKKESRDKNIRFIQHNGAHLFIEQSVPGLFSDVFKTEHPEKIRKLIERYIYFTPESLVSYLQAMKQRPDTTEILKKIAAPMLFIMGKEDKAVPLNDMLEQCHFPEISYIHILTQTAHMGMIENTILCKSIVDQFLDQFPY